jgi:pantetheine-phosphate adenylyltransferase
MQAIKEMCRILKIGGRALITVWAKEQKHKEKESIYISRNTKKDDKANQIDVIIKGLRAMSDFEYELQMAQVNLQGSGVESMFMATSPAHSFLSSSLIRELAHYEGDVSSMVPPAVIAALKARKVGK